MATGSYTVTLTANNDYYSHVLTRTVYVLVGPASAFVESDGLVVMEAKHWAQAVPQQGHAWQTRTGLDGYAGDGYVQALPDVGARYDGAGGPELQYGVYFDTPGAYTVWAYGAAADAGGDSLHVGLNGQPEIEMLTGFRYRQWSWTATDYSYDGANHLTQMSDRIYLRARTYSPSSGRFLQQNSNTVKLLNSPTSRVTLCLLSLPSLLSQWAAG